MDTQVLDKISPRELSQIRAYLLYQVTVFIYFLFMCILDNCFYSKYQTGDAWVAFMALLLNKLNT